MPSTLVASGAVTGVTTVIVLACRKIVAVIGSKGALIDIFAEIGRGSGLEVVSTAARAGVGSRLVRADGMLLAERHGGRAFINIRAVGDTITRVATLAPTGVGTEGVDAVSIHIAKNLVARVTFIDVRASLAIASVAVEAGAGEAAVVVGARSSEIAGEVRVLLALIAIVAADVLAVGIAFVAIVADATVRSRRISASSLGTTRMIFHAFIDVITLGSVVSSGSTVAGVASASICSRDVGAGRVR